MSDVAPTPEADETAPNEAGKHAVQVSCGECSTETTIFVPDGHADYRLRFEHPCGAVGAHPDKDHICVGEWINPDVPEPVDPLTGDVVWDPERREYVKRVVSGERGVGTASHSIG